MLSHCHVSIPEPEGDLWRKRVLQFGAKYSYFSLLENRGEAFAPSWLSEGWMAGIDCKEKHSQQPDFFSHLTQVEHQLPLFGYLGYDLKNQVEKLSSANEDHIHAPDALLFEPVHYLRYERGILTIASYHNADLVLETLLALKVEETESNTQLTLQSRMSKDEYLQKVEKVIDYIREGEVYELNLCMEYFAKQVALNPIHTYQKLMSLSKVPFAAYLKTESIHTLCASPERFLKKQGNKLLSQPIKGTRKRGSTALEDEALKNDLLHSEKDRAENVMIVDLVRNDLARCCKPGTVEVEELFGIYSFSNVHQMISTVSGIMRDDQSLSDALRCTFPMGSMTGAPKIRAMELIEELENSKRGIYSGSIGVIYPNGDFDFNVVIRSVLYNEKDSYLSVHAGGAITYDSKGEEEWEEINTKLSNIRKLFEA